MIMSPINGVVLQKYRELGDTISSAAKARAAAAPPISRNWPTWRHALEVDINESRYRESLARDVGPVIPDAYDNPFPARS